jgi:hypothetical protein
MTPAPSCRGTVHKCCPVGRHQDSRREDQVRGAVALVNKQDDELGCCSTATASAMHSLLRCCWHQLWHCQQKKLSMCVAVVEIDCTAMLLSVSACTDHADRLDLAGTLLGTRCSHCRFTQADSCLRRMRTEARAQIMHVVSEPLTECGLHSNCTAARPGNTQR